MVQSPTAKDGNHAAKERQIAARPGQASPGAPHWIVMNLSRHKELPVERRVALFFRHPSYDSAVAEAQRLAERHPGNRYAVYGSGPSFKHVMPEPGETQVEAWREVHRSYAWIYYESTTDDLRKAVFRPGAAFQNVGDWIRDGDLIVDSHGETHVIEETEETEASHG